MKHVLIWRPRVLALGALALFSSGVVAGVTMSAEVYANQGDVMDNRPSVHDRPAELVEQHDCWIGDAPADMRGRLPGHVVVTLPDERTVYRGEHMVSRALAQRFDGKDRGLTIHGFCR